MKNRLDRIVTKSGDSGLTSINPNKRISKKGHLISISRLNSTWFQNTMNAPLEKVKL